VAEHIEFESSPDAYQVKLDAFEGPLDLLLHLIRTNELNVYDIPIALITEQYLGYITLMQDLNLDVAGEFLVMAATLIHIKSKMLLPRPETDLSEGGPEEDPREALVRRLLEHQKYKAAAGLLHDRETLRSAQFMRPDARVADVAGDEYEPELEVDLFTLLAAFKGVLERANRRPRMVLPPEQMSIEDRIHQLLGRLSETEACGFEDLFSDGDGSRAFMIVTFLAMLEMIRLKLIRVFQSGSAGPIRVYKRARPADAPHPIDDPQGALELRMTNDTVNETADAPAETTPTATAEVKAVVEALIFASPEPITPKMLYKLLSDEPKEDVLAAVNALKADYENRPGLQMVEVAGGFQIVTRPELHEWVRRLFHERSTQKLTAQGLETLAVIAYKQPITALEITEIRGVNTTGVLSTLLERHLIKIVGRKNVVGRPFLYATTKEFLIRFGLKDLNDLPKIEDMAEALGFEPPAGLVEQSPREDVLPLTEDDFESGKVEQVK